MLRVRRRSKEVHGRGPAGHAAPSVGLVQDAIHSATGDAEVRVSFEGLAGGVPSVAQEVGGENDGGTLELQQSSVLMLAPLVSIFPYL